MQPCPWVPPCFLSLVVIALPSPCKHRSCLPALPASRAEPPPLRIRLLFRHRRPPLTRLFRPSLSLPAGGVLLPLARAAALLPPSAGHAGGCSPLPKPPHTPSHRTPRAAVLSKPPHSLSHRTPRAAAVSEPPHSLNRRTPLAARPGPRSPNLGRCSSICQHLSDLRRPSVFLASSRLSRSVVQQQCPCADLGGV